MREEEEEGLVIFIVHSNLNAMGMPFYVRWIHVVVVVQEPPGAVAAYNVLGVRLKRDSMAMFWMDRGLNLVPLCKSVPERPIDMPP
jgi:hypothetical protein